MNKQLIKEFICCPIDKKELQIFKRYLKCLSCGKKYGIKDGVIKILPQLTPDVELSMNKWDLYYKNILKNKSYLEEEKKYLNMHYKDALIQINNVWKKNTKSDVFLEIGCGPAFLSQQIARSYRLVIGIDICPNALKIAKLLFDKKGIKNYLLIQSNILETPFKSDSIDIIYGGGVIEHFQNTEICVKELYRILKKRGLCFNTVPCLNLGSLTYRQIWGNIPNFPVLKQIAELIHIHLFRRKFMIFGYELSFLPSTLIQIHKRIGFTKIIVDKFNVHLMFDFIPRILRKGFIRLAEKSSLFWPMIYVAAKK